MVTKRKTPMRNSQTSASPLEANTREIARVAWKQAIRADQKLDEIKTLIESGESDRALVEMSDFVGAKKPRRKADYDSAQQVRKTG
jgi:hypothetical protein